jgi:hypothetical protein
MTGQNENIQSIITQPDLFEEKECDELSGGNTEIEIIDEQTCIHSKSIHDYCPHCTEDEFDEIFRNWEDDIENVIDSRNEI